MEQEPYIRGDCILTKASGHQMPLGSDFLDTIQGRALGLLKGMDFSKCCVDASAFDLMPFKSWKLGDSWAGPAMKLYPCLYLSFG